MRKFDLWRELLRHLQQLPEWPPYMCSAIATLSVFAINHYGLGPRLFALIFENTCDKQFCVTTSREAALTLPNFPSSCTHQWDNMTRSNDRLAETFFGHFIALVIHKERRPLLSAWFVLFWFLSLNPQLCLYHKSWINVELQSWTLKATRTIFICLGFVSLRLQLKRTRAEWAILEFTLFRSVFGRLTCLRVSLLHNWKQVGIFTHKAL